MKLYPYLTNKLFKPKEILDIYSAFDMQKHFDDGFDTILLDIDNTIAIPDTGHMDENAKQFINDLKKVGYKVCIFSNNTYDRVKSFVGDNDVNFLSRVCKPLPFGFYKAFKKLNTTKNKTIVMGDQLLTDILGANLSGCYGIYCKQLQKE